MKIMLLLPAMFLFVIMLSANVITVNGDGTGNALTIQQGIDVAANSDTVIISQGIWTGSININNKAIILGSYYIIDGDTTHISRTIIDGEDVRTGIIVNNCSAGIDTMSIVGLTIRNCRSNWFPQTDKYSIGGGIGIGNSRIIVSNCGVYYCRSYYGGGIGILQSQVYLRSNTIYKNSAIEGGGGVCGLGYDTVYIEYDEHLLNSIYLNNSPTGCDIAYASGNIPTSVYLDKGTISNANQYFYFCTDTMPIIVNQAVIQQVNHDLWVSPTGNDNNNGLSVQSPLKTISLALAKAQPENGNTITLHILSGTYSWSLNRNALPLQPKSYVNIVGINEANVVLDAENYGTFINGEWAQDYIVIKNLTLINGHSTYGPLVKFEDSFAGSTNKLNLKNITLLNSWSITDGIRVMSYHDVTMDNLIIRDSRVGTGLLIWCYERLSLSNSTVQRLHSTNYDTVNSACCAVSIEKPLSASSSQTNIKVSNCLVADNTDTSQFWQNEPSGLSIGVQGGNCEVNIVNCTIANNSSVTQSGGLNFSNENCDVNVINTIVSGNTPYEVSLYAYAESSYANVNFANSLVTGGDNSFLVSSNNINHTWDTDNLFGLPGFVGDGDNPYWLSADSPCIDAGVADTTGLNLPITDLAGNQRVWNGRIDIGCYEYGAPPVGNDNPTYPILPNEIQLSTYPNPVYLNGTKGAYTFIEFTLPEKTKQRSVIEIYNLKGQKVRTIEVSDSYNSLIHRAGLDKQVKQNGELYSTVWDLKNDNNKALTAGIYLCKVSVDGKSAVKKLTILK